MFQLAVAAKVCHLVIIAMLQVSPDVSPLKLTHTVLFEDSRPLSSLNNVATGMNVQWTLFTCTEDETEENQQRPGVHLSSQRLQVKLIINLTTHSTEGSTSIQATRQPVIVTG